MSAADLEQRYRRLLASYPWSHRRVYEEEMLAVLVAGARPGQRRPTLGDAANLVASGLRSRAGAAVTALAAPAWRDAAAVFGLLAALGLLSQRVVRLFDPYRQADPSSTYGDGWAAVVLRSWPDCAARRRAGLGHRARRGRAGRPPIRHRTGLRGRPALAGRARRRRRRRAQRAGAAPVTTGGAAVAPPASSSPASPRRRPSAVSLNQAQQREW